MTDIAEASHQFMLAADRATTLWDMTEEWLDILQLLDDPEIDPHIVEQELDRLDTEIAHKVENIAGLIRRCENVAAFRRVEGKKIADSATRFEDKAEWLRGYVLKHMRATNKPRIETGRYTVSIRQNPPHVEVLEAMLVPSEFQRTKIDISVDKKAILEHTKTTGEVVPGTTLARTERLDIR